MVCFWICAGSARICIAELFANAPQFGETHRIFTGKHAIFGKASECGALEGISNHCHGGTFVAFFLMRTVCLKNAILIK